MTIQPFSRIYKYLFIISIIFPFSGCDIIDEMMGSGNEKEKENDNSNISKIEVEYFIDNAIYDHTSSGENQGEFTSIAGTSSYENNVYHTIFDNPPVLGKKIRGEMKITFKEENGNRTVNVNIDQNRDWNWDETTQDYESGNQYDVTCNSIPYNKSFIDEFDEDNVDEFYLGGNALSGITLEYNNHGIWGTDEYTWLTSFTCGNRAFIKVKVHYK